MGSRLLHWFRPTFAGVWYVAVLAAVVVGATSFSNYPPPWRNLLNPLQVTCFALIVFVFVPLGAALQSMRLRRPLLLAPLLIVVPAVVAGAIVSQASLGYPFGRPGPDGRLKSIAKVETVTEIGSSGDGVEFEGSGGWTNPNNAVTGWDFSIEERVRAAMPPGKLDPYPALPVMPAERLATIRSAVDATGAVVRPQHGWKNELGGYAVEATLRDGTPVLVLSLVSNEVSNDRRAYCELLFQRDANGRLGRLLSSTAFLFDTDTAIDDWRLVAVGTAIWLLPIPLLGAADRARWRRRTESASGRLPSPAE
jgi:hypothetical protein